MESWSPEQRRLWIFEQVKRTLTRANEGTALYRERFRKAGFDPTRDFQTLNDITRVPVLTKQDVRTEFERMIDRRFLRGSVFAHTSGTTGQPMTMRLNEWYVAFDYACIFRHWAKAGYKFRAPYAAVRSYVPQTPEGPLWVHNWWQNTLYMSAYHLKPGNCRSYLDELLRFRPHYIRGYPSSLSVLAEFAYPEREKFDFVRGVFTASETLSSFERATIERAFGPILYDWYGMTEPAVVITERSDHNGMEVNWEYGFPEFSESSELQANERKLIATSLHNPVMPFIRYDTEDIARVSDELDSFGLYPRVEAMVGRKDECLITPDGGRLPSLNFYSLLQTYTDILRFQFVQKGPSHVVLKLSVRSDASDVQALVSVVREEVKKRLGPTLGFEVEVTDQFLTSPDGKTPTFKRLFVSDDSGQKPPSDKMPAH
jgi:phenylacetate-CoA ligase